MSESSSRKSPYQGVSVSPAIKLVILLISHYRSLLITLSILRSLATECKRDIALLSSSLVASVYVTLSAVPADLEVVARAASVVCPFIPSRNGF